jgi:hypothetical protein
MAKIHEEVVVIKISKLVKDDHDATQGTLATQDTIAALEQVAQELVGEGVVVEVEKV